MGSAKAVPPDFNMLMLVLWNIIPVGYKQMGKTNDYNNSN